MDSSKERDPSYVYAGGAWVTIQECDTEVLKRISSSTAGIRGTLIQRELAKRGWTPPRTTSKSLEWTYQPK